jgi:hypothetical protein
MALVCTHPLWTTMFMFSFDLQKFNNEEWANMPTCNVTKIVHNIWLYQLKKHGICLYTTMLNNYVHVFKLFRLYKQYFQSNPPSHGPYRNEFF